MPNTARTAHADAVLGALGYKSETRGTRRGLKLVAVLLGLAALAALFLTAPWSAWLRPSTPAPAGTVAHKTPAPPAAPAPKVTPPAPLNAPAASGIASRDPKLEKPPIDPRTSKLDARSPAVTVPPPAPAPAAPAPLPATRTPKPVAEAVPVPKPNPPAASRIEGRDPKVGKLRTDPRPPSVDAGSPAASVPAPKPIAPAPDDFQLALYYQRSGEFEQSLLHYKAALQRDEMNIEAHNNLGHLYLQKGLFEEASREFQRVVAIDPKYSTAHVNLSAAYLSLGRFDAAAAEARAALQIDTRNPDAMVNLSLAQSAAGQAGDAQGSLRRALDIDPHNAAAHYNLARQFEASGDTSAAIDHYKQFIQYASPEQTAFAADVRTHLAALGARVK